MLKWKCKQAWNWSCFCVVPILGKQSHTTCSAQYFSPARLAWNSLVRKAKMKQFSSLILSELIESKIIKSLCQKKNNQEIYHITSILKIFLFILPFIWSHFHKSNNKCSLNVPYSTHRTTSGMCFFFLFTRLKLLKLLLLLYPGSYSSNKANQQV